MRILDWFRENQTEITWWVIGWLTFAVFDCLYKEDYSLAAVNAALIAFNYYNWKRLQ